MILIVTVAIASEWINFVINFIVSKLVNEVNDDFFFMLGWSWVFKHDMK